MMDAPGSSFGVVGEELRWAQRRHLKRNSEAEPGEGVRTSN